MDKTPANHTQNQFLKLAIMLLVCLIWSKFLLSISMIGIFFLSFIHRRKSWSWRLTWPYALWVGIFLLPVISGIHSDNHVMWWHHVKMKLPFLILPFAFYNLPKIDSDTHYLLHFIFGVIMVFSAIPTMVDYYLFFDDVQLDLKEGRSMELPIQHVKYSYFLAFAILSTIVLLIKKWQLRWKWEKYIQGFLIILGVLFLHLLAVRTGLLLFYGGLLLGGMGLLFRHRKYRWIIPLLLMVFLGPIVAYVSIPSFQEKVHYTFYDLDQFRTGEGGNYSDAERLQSLQIGWELVKENPWIGTGIGDLQEECRQRFIKHNGATTNVLYPHNQLLFVAAGMGVLIALIFIVFFFYPFIKLGTREYELFLLLGLTAAIVLMVDNGLERSYSVGFFVFFYLVGINRIRD